MRLIHSDGEIVDLSTRVAEREARRASLSDRPLNDDEMRAVAFASARYRPGSDAYHGARDGWLIGLGAPAWRGLGFEWRSLFAAEPHSPEYWEACWAGFDVARLERARAREAAGRPS